MKTPLIYFVFLYLALPVQAQPGRGDIRSGNRAFKNAKFDNAELAYRKALEDKKVNNIAEFNLGDALYKQKKYEEAGKQFESVAASEVVKANSAKAYHNLGNSYLQSGKIEESINAYKEALRRSPTDLDTKYNLSYAQMMKKKQEENKNNDKNDQKDQQDNKDQKDQKDPKESKDQKDQKDQKDPQQQQPDQAKEKQDQQQAKQQNVKISKEDAKRLLEALATDEKKVQEKVKKEKAKANKVRTIKDW